MNWGISTQGYPYLTKVLTIGDASLAQGQPSPLLRLLGVPTRSTITEFVGQCDANYRHVRIISKIKMKIRRQAKRIGKHTERKPDHDKLTDIINHLNIQEKQPNDVMAAAINSPKVHHSVQSHRKGAIQQPSMLTDEFGCSLRDTFLAFCCLPTAQMPLEPALGHELRAQDAVLCQEHVLFEDIDEHEQ